MPDERKMIIKSLVYRFSDIDAINGKIPAPWTADFVQNKGEGQIFLLHGSPGVGKTLVSACLLLYHFFIIVDFTKPRLTFSDRLLAS
jgi:DNA polymerase III delta prime subunit